MTPSWLILRCASRATLRLVGGLRSEGVAYDASGKPPRKVAP